MLKDRKLFCIRQHFKFLSFSREYNIYEPSTAKQIGVAKEENSFLINLLRFFTIKLLVPNRVNVYDTESNTLYLTMKKPFNFNLLNREVSIRDGEGNRIGKLKHSIIGTKRQFSVYNHEGEKIGLVQGDWKGWSYNFKDNSGMDFGSIKKKWTEIGKETFSMTENFTVTVDDENEEIADIPKIILAASLAIDMMFKEK